MSNGTNFFNYPPNVRAHSWIIGKAVTSVRCSTTPSRTASKPGFELEYSYEIDLWFIAFITHDWLYYFGVIDLGAEVCWPPYGCYNDDEPFDINWVQLPQSPQYIGTKFMLYTRKERTTPQLLNDLDANTISVSHFDGRKKTVFMAHGYLGKLLRKSCFLLHSWIKTAFYKRSSKFNYVIKD